MLTDERLSLVWGAFQNGTRIVDYLIENDIDENPADVFRQLCAKHGADVVRRTFQ